MTQTKLRVQQHPISYYLSQAYPIMLYPDAIAGYTAEIKDLPGCITQGETVEEAVQNLEEAKLLWLETAYEDGMDIPNPSTTVQYSGRFALRMPKTLHREVAEQAQEEGLSINQYLNWLITKNNQIRQNLSLIVREFTARSQKAMTLQIEVTKKGKQLTLEQELDIPDGKMTIEIPLPSTPMTGKDHEILDKIIRYQPSGNNAEEILKEIYKERDENMVDYGKE